LGGEIVGSGKWRGRKLAGLAGEKRGLLARIDLVRCQRTNQILRRRADGSKNRFSGCVKQGRSMLSNNHTTPLRQQQIPLALDGINMMGSEG